MEFVAGETGDETRFANAIIARHHNCQRIDEYEERKEFPRELLHVKTFGKFIMAFLMFEGRTWRESIDPRSQRASNCSPASPGLLLGVREKWLRGGRFSEACRI